MSLSALNFGSLSVLTLIPCYAWIQYSLSKPNKNNGLNSKISLETISPAEGGEHWKVFDTKNKDWHACRCMCTCQMMNLAKVCSLQWEHHIQERESIHICQQVQSPRYRELLKQDQDLTKDHVLPMSLTENSSSPSNDVSQEEPPRPLRPPPWCVQVAHKLMGLFCLINQPTCPHWFWA